MKKALSCFFLLFLCASLLSCKGKDDEIAVDLEKRQATGRALPKQDNSIKFAVGAMITPKEGFAYYRKMLRYLEDKTGYPIKYIDRESYAEINGLLKDRELDAAFVCSGPYVEGHDEFGLELLAVPVAYGETVYYSYIIVPSDSPVTSFEQLRGKTFAFTDPKSNSGKLVPTYMLSKMGETPESFFSSYTFTYAHDKSIRAVAGSIVDGAAVDSLIWEYENKKHPELTSRTRVILKSPPYGIPPVVVRSGLDEETREALRRALLDMHNDRLGQEILRGMMIDKFVEPDDGAYETVREMLKWLSGGGNETQH